MSSATRTPRVSPAKGTTLTIAAGAKWRDAKRDVERFLLEQSLKASGGNMAAASRLLGITKVATLHAVRRHGLEHLTTAGGRPTAA